LKLDAYFALPDWPMKNSPAGKIVQLVHQKRPELSAEECLLYTRLVMNRAAGSKNYRVTVYSAADEPQRRPDFAKDFDRILAARRKLSAEHPEKPRTTIPEAADD
jgi:hypothetical protein